METAHNTHEYLDQVLATLPRHCEAGYSPAGRPDNGSAKGVRGKLLLSSMTR